jgi:ribonucleoside-triphosphate reductase
VANLKDITIIKSDGSRTSFKGYKIKEVFSKLTDNADLAKMLRTYMTKSVKAQDKTELTSGEMRMLMVQTFLDLDQPQLAKKYADGKVEKDKQWAEQISPEAKLQQLFGGDSSIVNENANKDSNLFNTQRDLIAGMVGKSMGLEKLPKSVAKAHLSGDLHYHDLDFNPMANMSNCCLVDLKGMLKQGFKIGNAQVGSPKSIQTATALMAQITGNVAAQQYGGISYNRLDETLAPYAELNFDKHMVDAEKYMQNEKCAKWYDYARDKTAKDIYDAMQSLEYEINTLFSTSGQTPFVTVGFGLGTSWFEREIQKAILNIRLEGLGEDHRTAIFPKLVYGLKKGTNLNHADPNYDIKQLAIECATKRMYPDVLMFDKLVELTGSYKAPMGCRSFLHSYKIDEEGYELEDNRNNFGVVTLNLPRIALESEGDKEVFWDLFEERLGVAKEALMVRFNSVKQASPKSAPILYQYGALGKRLKPEDTIDEIWKNKRATISLGYIGLYEVGTVFYGPNWETVKGAKEFTLEIMKKMYDKCVEWEEETDIHFSVYGTPSESLTDKFSRLDKAKFGVVPDVTDKDYYNNSFHYDIRKKPSPFEKLKFESAYLPYTSGGFIQYVEYPNLKQNPKALEAVWDWAYNSGSAAYLGTDTPIDACFKCGFNGEFESTARGFKCPECGNHDPEQCDVVKRVCGYLGNPQARPMVKGRHEEITHRAKHISERDVENLI